MTLTTGTAGPLLTPEHVESLLIEPVLAASVASSPSTTHRCALHRATLCPWRISVVAAW
jgi:hypothetical protein